MMSFEDACDFRMPFGKYRGQSIADIGATDEGLKYLDWLRGQGVFGQLKAAIDAYLGNEVISRELDTLLGN